MPGDCENFIIVVDHKRAHDRALFVDDLDTDHTHTASALGRVLVDGRALAESLLGDVQERGAISGDVAGDEFVAGFLELQADDTSCVSAHLANLALFEPNRLAEPARKQDVEDTVGGDDLDEFVIVVEFDGDEPGLQ